MPIGLELGARGSCRVVALGQESLGVGETIYLAGCVRLISTTAPGMIANVLGSEDQVVGGGAVAGRHETTVVAALTGPVFAKRWRGPVARGRFVRSRYGRDLRKTDMSQGCSDERGCNNVCRNLQNQAFRCLYGDHFSFHGNLLVL